MAIGDSTAPPLPGNPLAIILRAMAGHDDGVATVSLLGSLEASGKSERELDHRCGHDQCQ
jgi:hypothetical protein